MGGPFALSGRSLPVFGDPQKIRARISGITTASP